MIMNMIHNIFLPHSLLRNMNIIRSIYAQLLMFSILIPSIRTATFKYNPGSQIGIKSQGDASFTNDGIQLTAIGANNSTGRALYAKPVRLYDSATGELANFSTRFSFLIKVEKGKEDSIGDGLAFFLAPDGSTIPPVSNGSLLGLFNGSVMFNSTQNPAVAVEFDTYHNYFDPYDTSSCHIGIDINSIKSNTTSKYECSLFFQSQTNASISYDSSSKYLSIHVSPGNIFLSYSVDLKDILGEWVNVGFTAATGGGTETHQILSWEFNWTGLEPKQKTNTAKLVIVLAVGIPLFIVVVVLVLILFMWQKKGNRKNGRKEIILGKRQDLPTDDDYELKGRPTKYSYNELVLATDDFREYRELGKGAFGIVYKGTLSDSNVEVAVKKLSKESQQGKKEFDSEVKTIGLLAHRNLVRLLGWCHERGDFLLVYEYLSNHSLDFHLFRGESVLIWKERYKIANDLASALLYLHEEWYKCVVHRDIKSSNILLDSVFNAKLGDFGLARFADHAQDLKSTYLGGTTGYIAPECIQIGSSKASDIFSFGVVVLEIACGRRPVLVQGKDKDKVHLAEWVLKLYASGRLLEAADTKLGIYFDERQMERLMVVGLWCTTYDYNLRPSIKQVSSILNMQAPLPDLTQKIPLSTPFTPSMLNQGFSSTSSSSATTDKQGYQSRTSGSTHQTSSTHSSEKVKYSSATSQLQSEPR